MARRKKTTRRRVYHRRRRAHVRSNPPRRRRRHRLAFHRRRRRHYRRNPGFGGGTRLFGGMSIPPVKRIAGGLVGMAAARALPGYAKRFLPSLAGGAAMDLALGAIAGMVSGMLAGKFMGKQFGEDVAFGAILGVADDAARMYVYPAVGLSAYLEPSLGAYLQPRIGQYLSPGATLPALGDMYDFNEGDDMGNIDLPSRLNPSNRL